MPKTSLILETGHVVVANLNPTQGDEKQKKRPCVIIEVGGTPLKLAIVLPITDDNGKRARHHYVSIPNFDDIILSKPSVIDCYQIRTLSMERLEKKSGGYVILGKISTKTLDQIRCRLALILDITDKHTSTW